MTTGSYGVDDLLAVRFASAAEFGLDTINDVLQRDLAYYNAQVVEQLSYLAEPLTEQSRIYGTSATVPMMELDEFGKPTTKKNAVGVTVSFPMRLYGAGLGWTAKYFQIATPAEIAAKYLEVRRGYAEQINKEIKKAIYNDTNYNFVDKLVNGVTLAVKRFVNADSATIPDSPAGVSFDGATHTHYLARVGALAASDINSLVDTITEHGHTKGLKMVIALADKATVSAVTGFTALTNTHVVNAAAAITDVRLTGEEDVENMLIGYWNGLIPVWVKPWALANYVFCFAADANEKALGYRQRPQAALQGLRIAAEINDYPLIAQNSEAEFGFGVWNRTAGAVLQINNTTWQNPTIV